MQIFQTKTTFNIGLCESGKNNIYKQTKKIFERRQHTKKFWLMFLFSTSVPTLTNTLTLNLCLPFFFSFVPCIICFAESREKFVHSSCYHYKCTINLDAFFNMLLVECQYAFIVCSMRFFFRHHLFPYNLKCFMKSKY